MAVVLGCSAQTRQKSLPLPLHSPGTQFTLPSMLRLTRPILPVRAPRITLTSHSTPASWNRYMVSNIESIHPAPSKVILLIPLMAKLSQPPTVPILLAQQAQAINKPGYCTVYNGLAQLYAKSGTRVAQLLECSNMPVRLFVRILPTRLSHAFTSLSAPLLPHCSAPSSLSDHDEKRRDTALIYFMKRRDMIKSEFVTESYHCIPRISFKAGQWQWQQHSG